MINMSAPFFFIEQSFHAGQLLVLPEESSRHMIQVLRMESGEEVRLTDGAGGVCRAVITDPHKKRCTVRIDDVFYHPSPEKKVCVAISPLKNSHRFEWFLEKATEIGISEILPIICHRTEKLQLRMDRLRGILVSAMLQSQQVWLPALREPQPFAGAIASREEENRWIAYCDEQTVRVSLPVNSSPGSSIILIGPEGDFTPEEAAYAMEKGYTAVTLGNNRLRTETAGMVAATLLQVR